VRGCLLPGRGSRAACLSLYRVDHDLRHHGQVFKPPGPADGGALHCNTVHREAGLAAGIDGPAAAWPTGMAICLANEAETRSALTDGGHLQMALTIQLAHTAQIRLSALLASHTQSEPAILRLGR
jgi:hypothetical protein